MASYDSDSSEEGEFTETNVLLGYASRSAAEGEDTISKLGGYPEWLEDGQAPSSAFAKCKICSHLMPLLLQLNAELPEKFPGHDRRIYVFACKTASCRRRDGSIRVLRGVRVWKEVPQPDLASAQTASSKEEAEEKKEAKPALGDALFGGSGLGSSGAANPFSPSSSASSRNPFSSSNSSTPANPFSSTTTTTTQPPSKPKAEEQTPSDLSKTFAETLALNVTPAPPQPAPEPWPEASSLPQPYTTLYVNEAAFETLDPPKPTAAMEGIQIDSADAPEPSALDREAFESTMDATFQKFADRMSQNPEQVIRYEFGGVPLLYSKKDAVGDRLTRGGMPRCPNCGGRRVFEVQLTPNAIAELEADELGLEGMEWGTIIVGVCEKDCRPRSVQGDKAGYVEEWAGVQWEELAKRK